MNTFQIYEDFKGFLGEPAAKSLAHTLGTMFEELRNSVTKEDFRILRESIDANVSRLDSAMERLADAQGRTEAKVSELAVAQAHTDANVSRLDSAMERLAEAQARTDAKVSRLDSAIERLAEAQAHTDAKVSELAVAQARTETKVSELAVAQARTETKVSELAVAQARTESTVAELVEGQTKLTAAQADVAVALQRLTIRTDAVVGRTFELQFRDRLTAYLGRFLRRGRLIANDELLDTIEKVVDDREAEDFLRADAIAEGMVDGNRTYVVVEVSSTGDADDIVRAERRAATLQKAGLAAIALVACDAISPESLALARMRGVRIWCNGSMIEAAA